MKKYYLGEICLNITKRTIRCGHQNHDYQTYYEVSFKPGDSLLESAKTLGLARAKKVHPAGTDGRRRPPDVILRRNILGVLAELATREILETAMRNKRISASITHSGVSEIQEWGDTEIDITILVGDKEFEMEVRSSFLRNPLTWGITQGFDIIGWYTTLTKPTERRKDFYLRVLYNFRESEAPSYIESGLTLYFVGGASKALLQGPRGYNDNLDQQGANYRLIKPICAGRDADKILDEILG